MSVDLPILRSVTRGKESDYCVWEPGRPIVVLGRGGREEQEIIRENCDSDDVPVFRRRTGGGSVVLSPGCLVFSLARRVGKELVVREYVHQVNNLIMEFLSGLGFHRLSIRGISDICMGDRKILGSGMFRRKKIIFFQGSMLIDPDLSLMERYLKLPRRQPDYRAGRSHRDFMTTLRALGWRGSTAELALLFDEFLGRNIERIY